MDEIADVITASDPDIVVLIEVEGIDALQRLNTNTSQERDTSPTSRRDETPSPDRTLAS